LKEKYIKVLGNSFLFKDMSKDEIEKMLICLNPTINRYEKNELITREGDLFEALGLLLEGKANVYKRKSLGARVVMTMLHEGDVFGEMAAFSEINKWPATVQCIEKCTVMFIPKINIIGECEKMCPWHRRLIGNFVKIVSVKALMLSNKVEYLTIKSMRGKLQHF
jgi:CRP-like cAMP-binding protein